MLSTCRGNCRPLAAINRPAEVLPSHESSAEPAFRAKRPVARLVRLVRRKTVARQAVGGGVYPAPSGQAGYSSGGNGAGAGGGGSSGGGGNWGDGADEAGAGDSGKRKGGIWAGWEARCAADSQFAYKVAIEQIIGVGAAVLGDMSSRPYWGLYELDFVFSTLIVGSIVNFSLMYLLASLPATSAAAQSGGLVQKIFSEQTLRAWGAPAGHMFQPGFPFSARVVNLAYKGFVFALVGMAAGLTGTAVSNSLIFVRQKLDPKFKPQNQAPNVVLNAATWATHMGISSNVRYQMLNGLDMVLQPALSPTVFKVFISVIRTANNVLGGISFVTLAKLFGVQSSQGDAVKQVAKQHVK